jgi:hypothetical protein
MDSQESVCSSNYIDYLILAFSKAGEESIDLAVRYCHDPDFNMRLSLLYCVGKAKMNGGSIHPCDYQLGFSVSKYDYAVRSCFIKPVEDDVKFNRGQNYFTGHVKNIAFLYVPVINEILNSLIYTPDKDSHIYRTVIKFEQMPGEYRNLEEKLAIWRKTYTTKIDNDILCVLIRRSFERHARCDEVIEKYRQIILRISDIFRLVLLADVTPHTLEKTYCHLYNLLSLIGYHNLIKHFFIERNYIGGNDILSRVKYSGPVIKDHNSRFFVAESDKTENYVECNYYMDGITDPFIIKTELKLEDICRFSNITRSKMLASQREIMDICQSLID